MKNLTTVYLIAMLLGSLVVTSYSCWNRDPYPASPFNLIGTWDANGLLVESTDSNTNPPSYVSYFDTNYAKHSQYSYQFKTNDTLIYDNYSVHPNLIKYGTYQIITGSTTSYGTIVLSFPPSNPDTLSFGGGSSNLDLFSSTDSSHIYSYRGQTYIPY